MLDLGDDGLGAPQVVDDGLELLHVGGPAHEALGEEIHLVLHAPADVGVILLRERIHGDVHADGMDALPRLQRAPDDHLRLQLVRALGDDLHGDGAIIQEPVLADLGPFEELRMRQGGGPGETLGDRRPRGVEDSLAPIGQVQGRLQEPMRHLGPCRSRNTGMERPSSAARVRT